MQPVAQFQNANFNVKTKDLRPVLEVVQPRLKLNDGHQIPLLGLGTWNAQGKELKDAVKMAIQFGYRHIDTAANYKNEHLVGEAIREAIDDGLVSREDLFVTTKLWNNSHRRTSVARALRKSLDELQLNYVDMYLIHYPIGYQEGDELSPMDSQGQVITSDVDYLETWQGMEDVKRLGWTRSIGVSNFNSQQLARLLINCKLVPVMNQVECHPYLNQSKLLAFCRSHGIQLTAYSPLGSPGRLNQDEPEVPRLIQDPLVQKLAKKYARPAAHILIRYQLQRQIVVIPKAIQVAHLKSNLESLSSFELSSDDLQALEKLNRPHRYMKFERCQGHKFYPFDSDF